MREHAIPQDVTGYRFHIIGNMTLKQFAEIGAGVILGIIVYSTNLPAVIKWPIICVVVGLGAMAAFVPFEERPFDHWITTFFRVLYKPTKFYWKRESKIPDPFLYKPTDASQALPAELDLRPARRERIKEYLTSVEKDPDLNQFDLLELNRLGEIMSAFNTVQTKSVSATKTAQRPDLKVRVRAIKPQGADLEFLQDRMAHPEEVVPDATVPAQDLINRQHLQTHQVAQEIEIPALEEISIESHQISPEETAYQNGNGEGDGRAFVESANDEVANQADNQTVVTNIDLPFPAPPTEPNKLVGMILSLTNNLINDAIVEIKDESGRVARAVKSNALGQFFITTPLADGAYTISVEHDGYQFNPLSLQLVGDVVAPIEIRSLS